MYSIAAFYFQPKQIIGVDIDEDALEIAKNNIDDYDLGEEIQLLQGDITASLLPKLKEMKEDGSDENSEEEDEQDKIEEKKDSETKETDQDDVKN